jgi:two-component system LytT family response regulator
MKKIKVIVIDDEYLNRDLIGKMIQSINPSFEVIAEAENIDTAFELITIHKPDLIFLDIKMPGGNGFELLKRFSKTDFEVVFITGFDEYAIQAFEHHALDYVLKPIDPDKLRQTLNKVFARFLSRGSITYYLREIIDAYNIDYSRITKIPIHNNNHVFLLDIATIISITANKGNTVFKITDMKEYTSSKQLNSFEFILDNYPNMCRINKSVYINLNFIKSYSKGQNCMVTLTDGSVFEISRRKKAEILALLDGKTGI